MRFEKKRLLLVLPLALMLVVGCASTGGTKSVRVGVEPAAVEPVVAPPTVPPGYAGGLDLSGLKVKAKVVVKDQPWYYTAGMYALAGLAVLFVGSAGYYACGELRDGPCLTAVPTP